MSRRTTFRRLAGATVGVVAAVGLAACGQAAQPVSPGSSAAPSGGAAVTALATSGPVFSSPLDAVPASDGSATWFTAAGPSGPGVFVTKGGNTEPLATGAPFRNPTGLALTADDKGLLVADRDADAVFALPSAGGAPVELSGTRGLHPRGVEVAGDQVYVTGSDPANGSGAVFALPVAGGAPRTLATGLTAPDGVAVAPDGAVLVTDQPSSVLRLENGSATPLATDVRLGSPAGLTLSADGSVLMVSSLNPGTGTAQVLLLNPVTGATTGVFDDVISANHAAGGLHRAHNAGFAAWCDVSRSGRVYRVEF